MKKYALISLSDKSGCGELARELEQLGYAILSTSNTAKHLRGYCSTVKEVSDLTGFPEILDGRVKTLHPKVHAGILADRSKPEHIATLSQHGIQAIDIVVVNLYPFEQTLARKDATPEELVENIDIGGPSLIRAAAKNHAGVIVLTDPADYQPTLQYLRDGQTVPLGWRKYLAAKAFALTARYDALIAGYFEREDASGNPVEQAPVLRIDEALRMPLRYGENPHQAGAYYCDGDPGWQKLHGKEMSFNNLLDMDAALGTLRLFTQPTVVIVKHCNPCGIGSADTLSEAYAKAFAADTASPFGGIVALNRVLDMDAAREINAIFTEIILAPDFAEGVMDFLRKKKDRRVIRFDPEVLSHPSADKEVKPLRRGYLVQDWDDPGLDAPDWTDVCNRTATQEQREALAWAWKVVSRLRSNAIAVTTSDRVLGLGIGQTSRIDSVSIALNHAARYGHSTKGAVCASDGFFPYRDGVDTLAAAGITAIVQPGGSKSDIEVINACNEHGIAMLFTGRRHFRH